MKLLKTMFSITPEALNAVDMCRAPHELALSMVDSEVLRVTDINQSVVAAPPVGVNDHLRCDTTANNGLQRHLFAVRYDLWIDLTVTLEETEDDGLATGSATALAAHSTSAEVRLIDFNFASGEGSITRAFFDETCSDFEKDRGDGLTGQAG